MDSSFIVNKYYRNKKSKRHIKKEQKKRQNYITKLLMRIFLSSFLLLLLMIDNKYNVSYNKKSVIFNNLNKNISLLNISNIMNSLFGNIIPIIKDEEVSLEHLFEEVEYKDDVNYIKSSFSGITCLKSGIVIKKHMNEDSTVDITIQTEDGSLYTYYSIVDCSFGIYEYISKGTIIGNARLLNNSLYEYKIKIEKEGECFDVFNIS